MFATAVSTRVDQILKRGVVFSLSWRFKRNGVKVNKRWRYFTDEEVKGLDTECVAKLDWARGRAGVPFIITSGFRSPEDNERVMGVEGSAHTKGLAVDLRVQDSHTRYRIIQALILSGFNRIGIYTNHIHADTDLSLPQEVMWTGISH